MNEKRWRVLAGVILICLAAQTQAGDSYGEKVGRKLGIGLANIVTSWVEIPKCIINDYNRTNFFFGITGGTAQGLANTADRVLTGVLDVITFPLPTKPIPQPPLVWQNFDSDTHYGEAFRLDLD
ncbi:hypothetical protein MIN45_P1990 [Methylomarinovum tepidoasis]|uniref:Exosortase system-associated protein, TIGR04073 family n=1 Tax=Methylomarinovum tepidoasis TaxID=2840183 RepID=A0AAU9CPM9_9GAMM|nr:exosortase system-associated protein, TIGR04073 family [Methylomarinovum sp. IN45]BCX89617.1 hypothetical protein MIN45_P1990 [Methylomarinovum sp. IN45]